MRTRTQRVLIAAACMFTLAATGGPASAAPTSPAAPFTAATQDSAGSSPVHTRRACAAAPLSGRDECLALLRTASDGVPLSTRTAKPAAPPQGYGPAQLRSAYQLAAAAAARGGGQTVAIVDAYDDPNAEPDLAAYRAEYGLPSCTAGNGCFRKVNQHGTATPLPAADQGWAVEESLDVDMVSAVCPRCHILLVEANNNQDANLAAAVATAAKLGATQISNSYGSAEYRGETKLEPFYHQPGIEVTVAAGDSGYGVSYPAASAYVTAVGGTTLWPASNSRGWHESVWAGTGSGCSTQIPKPAWQHDACAHRTDNDVAAVADPATPVAMYDSYGEGGWLEAGGTSVGSPLIASVYALLGNARRYPGGSYFYSHRKSLFSVTSGNNGTCSPAYLCTAERGYSGPAGLGSPDYTGTAVTGGSCVSHWSPAPRQPVPGRKDLIAGTESWTWNSGIAVLSPRDVWTAGTYQDMQASEPAVQAGYLSTLEHWNGSRWSRVPSPDFTNGDGSTTSVFTALSFDKRSDGWAVGYHFPGAGMGIGTPMVAHWDGSSWSPSPVLDPVRIRSYNGDTLADWAIPDAVTAIGPDDVWLAGQYRTSYASEFPDGSFLEHWNGSAWSVAGFPGDKTVQLKDIDAVSASDIWAVGIDNATGGIALHWNGQRWQRFPLTSPKGLTRIYSVSGSSPGDIWAAGNLFVGTVNGVPHDIPFVEHWDGHAWSEVPVSGAASVSGVGTSFYSVAAISPADAWAVGGWWGQRGAQWESDNYLLAHWNGRRWTILPEPQPTTPYDLTAVSASGARNIWITGEQMTWTMGGMVWSPYLLRHGCGSG